MKQEVKASLTVEASLLFPFLFLLSFLLVQLTLYQYEGVRNQAAALYDSAVTERKWSTPGAIRFTDTAFDFFGK